MLNFLSTDSRVVFGWLVGGFFLSETLIMRLRSGPRDRREDGGSTRALMIGVPLVWGLAWTCLGEFPQASFACAPIFFAGIALLIAGLMLRWWSIATLGRMFTIDVAIRAEHRLIESGPYRYVRHPSYSAILLAYLGIALCLGNAASLLVIMLGTTALLLNRIRVEEMALLSGFGEQYRDYMSRTRRLVPALY
jgi:protein-S-isoprenylcysteine O-methyltransferase